MKPRSSPRKREGRRTEVPIFVNAFPLSRHSLFALLLVSFMVKNFLKTKLQKLTDSSIASGVDSRDQKVSTPSLWMS